jgi:UDP-glucose 4-epimerase
VKKNIKILITGSSGYIGKCLSRYLEKKFIVFGIDKNEILNKKKNYFKINILNYKKTFSVIKKIQPDLIVHLAGQSTIDNIKKKKDYQKNNVQVTAILMKICHKLNIDKIIFSSTAAVYKSSNKLLTENSKILPNNIYGKTKYDCEKLIYKYFKKKHFIIFRFFNVCSSMHPEKIGENHKPETHLIPIIFSKFFNNQIIKIYGNNFSTKDGHCIRDYIHIKDIVCAIDLGIKNLSSKNRECMTLNLGSGSGYSTLDIINYSKHYFKKKGYTNKLKFTYEKNRKGDPAKLVCALSKNALLKLNWYPKFTSLDKIFNDEFGWRKFILTKKIKIETIY